MSKTIITYAQNREDIILHSFLMDAKKGFYIDIGAYHPLIDSVTKYFYELGWTGVNIEPQSEFVELLKKDRPKDKTLQIGIADKDSTMTLYEYEGGGFSTFDETTKKERTVEKISVKKSTKVPVITLKKLWQEYKLPSKPEFMKIDVEGLEYQVLEGNDWKKNRPKVLCIEANHVHSNWHEYIDSKGYVFAFFDGLNEYFVAEEEKIRIERFKKDYPKHFLSRQNVVTYDQFSESNYYKTQSTKIEKEADILKSELKKAYEKISDLEAQREILLKEKESIRLEKEQLANKLQEAEVVLSRRSTKVAVRFTAVVRKLKKKGKR